MTRKSPTFLMKDMQRLATGFKGRSHLIRRFLMLVMLTMLLALLAILHFTWERTIAEQKQQLRFLSSSLAQNVHSHFSTYDLMLRGLGDELIYRGALEGSDQAQAYLERIHRSHNNFVGYGLVGLDGEFIVSSTQDLAAPLPNLLEGPDEVRRSFREAIATEEFQVGRPYYFAPLEEWIVPLRAPVFADNQLVGVLTAGSRLLGNDAPWASVALPDETQVALVHDVGYVNHLLPVPTDPDHFTSVYTRLISTDLQNLIARTEGFAEHFRPPYKDQREGNDYFIWLTSVPEYRLTALAMVPKDRVRDLWLAAATPPLLFWLLALLSILYSYRRVVALLKASDGDVRETNDNLNEAIAEYDELTRLIPVGVYKLYQDSSGKNELIYASERAMQLLWLENLPSLNKFVPATYELLHPEDRSSFLRADAAARERWSPFRWQGRFIIGGELRWLRFESDPHPGDDNDCVWNGVIMDITDQKQAESKINNLVFYDGLTQMPNRRLLTERVEQVLTRNRRNDDFAALLFIDVDDFKALNDTFGHEQGDIALRQLGRRLRQTVREQDTVARLGGDEFVILLTGLSGLRDQAAAQVDVVIEKIRRTVTPRFNLPNNHVTLTLSIGITLLDGREDNVDLLLQQADQAMYWAKDAGRNTHCFYDPKIQHELQEQLTLQRDLKAAVNNDELVLHYQRQVNSQGEIIGAEALVRWQHPERGLLMPDSFIGLAEQSGQIDKIGTWVLTSACEQLAQWQTDERCKHWRISVNVSAHQLRRDDFVDKVCQVLTATKAPPQCLILELTESTLLHEPDQAIVKMHELRELGVRFSLDDFGTGYSSLGYVNRLPITEIKIDRSFIAQMEQDDHYMLLVKTVLSLGQTLSLEVTAEGVETEAQRECLSALGCLQFQGYYFGRPEPVEQLGSH